MNVSFDYPFVLWALVLLLPLALFDIIQFSGKRKAMPPSLKKRAAASAFFFGLCLAGFIIAFASPRWGSGYAAGPVRRAVDVVVALDLSRSMDIRDVSQADTPGGNMAGNARPAPASASLSRLQRGLSLALDTAANLPELRFAVAVGRNRGILAVPLTTDSIAVTNFLEAVDGDLLTGRGTNLESLLDAAAGAFQDSSPAHRYILLVSDGESLSGTFRSAVDRCSRNRIAIISIALGSDTGQPVPASSAGSADQDQVNNKEPLVSSRDQRAMYLAAELTGGLYVDGNRAEALSAITGHLRSRAPLSDSGSNAAERTSRWFLFIIIAIVCYGASEFCMLKIRKMKPGSSK